MLMVELGAAARHEVRAAYVLPELAGDASFAQDLSRAVFVTNEGLRIWEAGKVPPTAVSTPSIQP